MKKETVVKYFGTQEKVADFIGEVRVKPFSRTAVVMWDDIIPVRQALFLDQYSWLIFDKKLYQTQDDADFLYQTQTDAD